MGARIGERHHRTRVLHHLDDIGIVAIVDGHAEQRFEIAGQREIDHHRHGGYATLPREFGQRFAGPRRIGHVVQRVPIRRQHRDARALVPLTRAARGGNQLFAQHRILELRALLRQRQLPDLAPHIPTVERRVRLERVQHVQCARVHLREHATARRRHLVEQIEIAAPDLGRLMTAEDAPGDRHTRFDREVLQPQVILPDARRIATVIFSRDFEDAGAGLAHRVDDAPHFFPGGDPARNRLVIRGLMVRRARCGKAHRTGPHRFLGQPAHALNFFLARFVLERARAHYVSAQRRVAQVTGVIDALGQAVHDIQIVGEGFPPPVDAGEHCFAGDVFGAFEIAEHEVRIVRAARRQREAAVAHHDARHAVVARTRTKRIPEHLGVHVGVTVHEARRDDVPFRIDGLLRTLLEAANRRDAAVRDSDIRAEPRCAGTVDDRAVRDQKVVGHGQSSPGIALDCARGDWL